MIIEIREFTIEDYEPVYALWKASEGIDWSRVSEPSNSPMARDRKSTSRSRSSGGRQKISTGPQAPFGG